MGGCLVSHPPSPFTKRMSPGPCTTRDRFSALAGAAMLPSCSGVSAGLGGEVVLKVPPSRVWQGRALDQAARGPEAGPAPAGKLGGGVSEGRGFVQTQQP